MREPSNGVGVKSPPSVPCELCSSPRRPGSCDHSNGRRQPLTTQPHGKHVLPVGPVNGVRDGDPVAVDDLFRHAEFLLEC